MSTQEIVRSEGWHRSQAGQDALRDEPTTEFGVTSADALRLLRKARRFWIFFKKGPNGEHGVFEVSKASARKEFKRLTSSVFPCALRDEVLEVGTLEAQENAKAVIESKKAEASS